MSKLFVDFHVDIDSDISDGELDNDAHEEEGEQYTVPTLEDTVRQLIEQTKVIISLMRVLLHIFTFHDLVIRYKSAFKNATKILKLFSFAN